MTDTQSIDEHGALINMMRQQAVNDLNEAMTHLRAARQTITRLMGNEIYDVEWAEGGDVATAALNLVVSAIDQIHGARAIAGTIANL